ncbi:MAG: endonuclease/exonuclease/phosphatase family protein [Symploca sp. SIO1B1]|nr:endonuclease/exonuclease/phosphatase family protein [Symploca sp. SIO1B1]
MKFVSLNTWGGRCGLALIRWLQEIQADIYCLQEVFRAPQMPSPTVPDGEGKTIDANLFGTLQQALPTYHGWFSAGSRGYINDSTWLELPLEYGIALFIHPSFSVTAQRSQLVHGEFRLDKQGSPPLSRTAQVIRCVRGECEFTIGHLHGLWQPTGKQDSPQRIQQAHRFRNVLESVARPNEALLACGDLNLLPDSATFEILGKLGLEDLNQRFNIHCTRSSLYKKPVRYADYMLANRYVKVDDFTVVKHPEISDHSPLVLQADLLRS